MSHIDITFPSPRLQGVRRAGSGFERIAIGCRRALACLFLVACSAQDEDRAGIQPPRDGDGRADANMASMPRSGTSGEADAAIHLNASRRFDGIIAANDAAAGSDLGDATLPLDGSVAATVEAGVEAGAEAGAGPNSESEPVCDSDAGSLGPVGACGAACWACPNGSSCDTHSDCQSARCIDQVCSAPAGSHPDIVLVVDVVGRDPGSGWSDSYSVGSRCYCESTFDHNIGGIEVATPFGTRTVRQVCDALGPGPGSAGRPVYNDIQCGNGPPNDAGDEHDCPGRVDIGRQGCGHLGPRWHLHTLTSLDLDE